MVELLRNEQHPATDAASLQSPSAAYGCQFCRPKPRFAEFKSRSRLASSGPSHHLNIFDLRQQHEHNLQLLDHRRSPKQQPFDLDLEFIDCEPKPSHHGNAAHATRLSLLVPILVQLVVRAGSAMAQRHVDAQQAHHARLGRWLRVGRLQVQLLSLTRGRQSDGNYCNFMNSVIAASV